MLLLSVNLFWNFRIEISTFLTRPSQIILCAVFVFYELKLSVF